MFKDMNYRPIGYDKIEIKINQSKIEKKNKWK